MAEENKNRSGDNKASEHTENSRPKPQIKLQYTHDKSDTEKRDKK